MVQISGENLSRIRRVEREINRKLFFICAVVTVVAMLMTLIEFFGRGEFPSSRINLFYMGVLFLYSIHKEMIRWLEEKTEDRQGEYFLYSWIGLTVLLYTINFLTKDYFCYTTNGGPAECIREASVITIEVAIVFLFTRLSKVLKVVIERR